ncbi:MAG: hypothetical protein JWR89_1983 [Tardiphaga sp.]|uniref:DUF3574 domain-containing protein n=1 Tax=Tardiphaga sp. TaxID=1926292 RepID=UPI00262041D7|nr:DUF3574 domain-containing protein [Tardiphaga sp.]MDB5502081.1 hypothetical protein [Tardiphaga sp.]
MRALLTVSAFGMAALLGGCASLPQPCGPPAQTMASAELIFGRHVGDRPGVSEAAFARFVATDITPRFPDGLTILDATGQWRDGARGILVREPSKVVLISFPDDAAKRAGLGEIAEAYKTKFQQQSVLISVRTACVSF